MFSAGLVLSIYAYCSSILIEMINYLVSDTSGICNFLMSINLPEANLGPLYGRSLHY